MLAGCAYGRAIDRGHDYVAQSRWRDALAEFDRARRLDPDEAEAQRLYEMAVPHAIAEAKREAGQAVAEGRYEDALEAARYVEDLDPAEGEAMRTAVARWVEAGVEGFIREEKMAEAYALALRGKALFGGWKPLASQLIAIRDHYLKRSDAAFARDDFRGALEALAVIEKHEPERAPLHAERRDRIRGAWADRVSAEARAMADAGHPGAAAALYARAHEIAGRPADRDAMRVQLASLEEHGMFSVALDGRGEPSRARVEEDAELRLRSVPGVHLASSAAEVASMAVHVETGPVRCRDESRIETDAVRYQSGSREVPNPAYQQLERAIARRAAEVEDHARREATARREAERTLLEARRCGRDVGRDEQVVRDAEREVEEASRRVGEQRERVERLERRLREAPAERRERVRRRLERARDSLRSLEAEEREAASREGDARRALEATRRRCREVVSIHDRAAGDAGRHGDARAAAERALRRAEAQRTGTPATVLEPVFSSFEFDVRHVTRICSGPLVVELEPAWRPGRRELLEHAHRTEDSTHPAFPEYGVAGDPLSFPTSEAQLVEAVDASASQAVVELVAAHVEDYYASMLDRAAATAGESPHLATDMMLALWVAGPEHLDAQARATIADHLGHHYEVANLEGIAH